MLHDLNNFIKWLVLKVFIIKEASNTPQKLQDFLFFHMKAIFSFAISTLNVYNLKKYLNILTIQERTFYYERFALIITNKK